MAEPTGTLEKLANTIGQALVPLATFFGRANVVVYFAQLGTVFPDGLASDPDVGPALDAVATTAGGLTTALTSLATAQSGGDVVGMVAAGADIIGQFVTLLSDLDAAASQIGAKDWTPLGAADVAAFVDQFAAKVFEDALLRTLERDRPEFISAGVLIGIIDRFRTTIAGGDPNDPIQVVTTRRLQLGRLASALSSPVAYLEGLVGWGSGSLDINALLTRVQAFLDLFSFGTVIDTSSGSPVLTASMLTAGLNSTGGTPGIDLVFNLGVPDGFAFTASLRPGYDISISAAGQLPSGLKITARPPSQLSVATPVTVTLSSALTRKPFGDETAVVILGQTGATRLQADAIALTAGVTLKADPGNATASGDVSITFGFTNAKAVVDFSKGDGFLQQIGPARPVEAPCQLAATWSVSGGLQLSGGASLVLTLPINLTVGPVNVPSIHLAFGVQNGAFPLEVSADLNATIGPVDVSVSRFGVLLNLSFPTAPARGNLGPAQLDVGVKFPTGLGIAIDAGPVSGGGFISFDEPNHRYFGALELSVYSVSVKAFGVIETKLPTGPGYSFLVIISAEFTPIQLGFGFTLNGVGGLLGINRSVDSNGLLTMIKTGQLDNVLFPTDVVDKAPAILNDVETLFPPTKGHYVFGPLAKIGWGTPTLVDGELGLIIEYPGPVLTIIGTVHAALPKQDDAVVELNLDVGGVLDFPNKKFSLDASLHDSRVGDYPISGDMAMRMNWGQNPNFALSLGGFNPHYNPPAGFPKLKPISVDLGSNGNPSIVLSGYMALTSNTAQVGAKLQASISKDGASLSGTLSFDALFVFSPFSFEADIEGGVSASIDGYGISLDFHGTLSGPSPWHLAGKVCISLWFFSACADFSTTLGGTSQPTLPGVDPWTGSLPANADGTQTVPGLQQALMLTGNWGGNPPAGSFQAVTLVAAPQGAQAPIDPLGSATFRQKAVPLDLQITAFAGTAPSPVRNLHVSQVVAGPQTVKDPATVNDYFAPGQYQKMKDADKLSSQSFVQLPGGFTVSSDALTFGPPTSEGLIYQDVTFAAPVGSPPTITPDAYGPSQTHVTTVSGQSAATKAGLRNSALAAFVDPKAAPLVNLANELYTIANIGNLVGATGFLTNLARPVATTALAAAAATSATARQALQVAPTFFVQPSKFVL